MTSCCALRTAHASLASDRTLGHDVRATLPGRALAHAWPSSGALAEVEETPHGPTLADVAVAADALQRLAYSRERVAEGAGGALEAALTRSDNEGGQRLAQAAREALDALAGKLATHHTPHTTHHIPHAVRHGTDTPGGQGDRGVQRPAWADAVVC
mmetsp:Transcript_32315/g.72909  ORF Transcript_32315/g.72909 Transcript_32315/m.72909 type:complete len:156 (+) Transcript_32315:939-1406(+)